MTSRTPLEGVVVLDVTQVMELEHLVAGKIKNIGIPVKLFLTPGEIRGPAPLLGQHTDEVLLSVGLDRTEIAHLRESGVIA